MLVRITDRERLDELTGFLQSRGDCVVERLDDDTLEVSLMGSYGVESMRMELYLRIRAWESARGRERLQVEIVG